MNPSFETKHDLESDYALPEHWLLGEEGIYTILHQAYVRRAVELVANAGASNVLEVGCGDGWNAAQLVKAGMNVTGVDLSPRGIAFAKIFVPGARFLCKDIRDATAKQELPEPFDAALMIEVIEHIPPEDCVSVLKAVGGFLKPGGILLITTPSTNMPLGHPHHYRHFTPELLRGLVEEAGLRVEHVEGYGDAFWERKHRRVARRVSNRFYVIKPLIRWLDGLYRSRCVATNLKTSHGIVLLARK